MIVAPISNSQIADDSRPAVTTAGEHSSAPEPSAPPAVVLSFESEVAALEAANFKSNPVSLPPAPALAAPANSAFRAAFSFDEDLVATWLLQPRASELPAMRNIITASRTLAANTSISKSTSLVKA